MKTGRKVTKEGTEKKNMGVVYKKSTWLEINIEP